MVEYTELELVSVDDMAESVVSRERGNGSGYHAPALDSKAFGGSGLCGKSSKAEFAVSQKNPGKSESVMDASWLNDSIRC
jgi:hypothetical protein